MIEPEMTSLPVLEIGGTHVSAALVRSGDWQVGPVTRLGLQAGGSADALLDTVARAGRQLAVPALTKWAIAIPGPFDYRSGIGRFSGVGKFEALKGIDIRAALGRRLDIKPAAMTFINDASAFLLGEWLTGAAAGTRVCAGLTLGTGVGSAFLRDGVLDDSSASVPPDGEVHLLSYRGRPLEDWVSRRALRTVYASRSNHPGEPDVQEIAGAARAGDAVAATVFHEAFGVLAQVWGPWLARFGAEFAVIGGAISGAWDLIEGPLVTGIRAYCPDIRVGLAAAPDTSPLAGAAYAGAAYAGVARG